MSISVGDTLPDATLLRMGAEGPEEVQLGDKVKGRKVVIFGLPGAFSGTCTTAQVPSFMRTKPDFEAKGVDEIICIAVNDPFVMGAWGESTGATDAGLTFLGDPSGAYAQAIGMAFDAGAVGFFGRLQRHAMLVEDGVVKILNQGDVPGQCEIAAGETLLEMI